MGIESMNLDFCSYYQYSDRKIKRINARNPYYAENILITTMYDTQFNPNDGINAVAKLEHFSDIPLAKEPNYVVAWWVNDDLEQVIDSRWFIMDYHRTRAGQWIVNLRRDVIAEEWDNIKNEPCFIDRGWVDYFDPLIFNDEGISFNQIKYKETALKDKTDCPWIVAYVAKYDGEGNPVNLSGTINRVGQADIVLDIDIDDSEFADVAGIGYAKDNYKL